MRYESSQGHKRPPLAGRGRQYGEKDAPSHVSTGRLEDSEWEGATGGVGQDYGEEESIS